jgi:voltage-gated potassium channel
MFISVGVVFYHLFKRMKFILGDPDLRGMFLILAVIILLGGVVYHNVEKWSFLDSVYFCVVTLATVGFGDLTPHTPFGKLFTIIYIFLGVGVLAVFVSTVAEHTLEEQRHRLQKKLKDGTEQAVQGLDAE